ncbi:hypothetical protein EN739_12020 [Mesorhizobium sp. M2A.F.Ca.ET.017.03.2.1]|uniref:hypothetical protein n=1 Tax=unclassified Mesorhizobium TaxID=325217 RepID=UPI000FCA6A43|nr:MULTISPECIES: hypothetical protein [unclassified Mesorhizobium]RUW38974.1 hypothetical protein EOA37_22070 [Mesorhizobium sp. M2A.F.Ca.ET.015.02.1.1]RVC95681.1 hypothetical protein EN739_12020 [Mesorhizobium sp. M2A.F.Ca.ET.017.03.2.1]
MAAVTVDWSINLTGLLTFALTLAAGVAAWVTVRLKLAELEKDFAEQRTGVANQFLAVNGLLKLLQERVEDIRAKGAHELAEFKLEVAKGYAGHEALREMEARLVKAIDDLGKRIEKSETRNTRSRA